MPHKRPPPFTPHTQRENDTTNGGLPPSILSNVLFVCGVNAGGLLCGTCALALGTLYLNNMSVYCTYIHTTYDFCMDNCGWRIWFLSQFWLKNMHSGSIFWLKKIWFWRQFAIILINFGPKIMFPSQIWTHNLYQKWKQLLGHNLHYNMHYDMHIASYACANALRGHNWYVMHAIMGGPQ